MAGRVFHISNRLVVPEEGKEPIRAGGLDEVIAEPPPGEDRVRVGSSGKLVPDAEWRLDDAIHHHHVNGMDYITVDMPEGVYNDSYFGAHNKWRWPLLHDSTALADPGFSAPQNRQAEKFCAIYADAIATVVQPEDTIIVHDYHFIELGSHLREHNINNPTGFFFHTPIPSQKAISELPEDQQHYARELFSKLHEYDWVGVQTPRDLRKLWPLVAQGNPPSQVNFYDEIRIPAAGMPGTQTGLTVAVAPVIGFTERYTHQAEQAVLPVNGQPSLYDQELAKASVVGPIAGFTWGRLDHTKNLRRQAQGWGRARDVISTLGFLFQHAAFEVGKSRAQISEYQLEYEGLLNDHAALTQKAGRPVSILYTPSIPRPVALGIARQSKMGLITPSADGMNLTAFEYVSAQNPENPGVLILSQTAGAAQFLTSVGAIQVNPFDPESITTAIIRATHMSPEERREMHSAAMGILDTNSNEKWQTTLVQGTGRAYNARLAEQQQRRIAVVTLLPTQNRAFGM